MNKGLLKLSSAVLSSAMLIGAFSFDVLAEDTKVVGDKTYIYNPATQWYECEGNRLLDHVALSGPCNGYLPTEPGNYVLEEDITIDKSTKYADHGYSVSESTTREAVKIDLNGYTIVYDNESDYFIDLSESANIIMTINDTSELKTGKISCDKGAPFVLIADTTDEIHPSFNLLGGKISGIGEDGVTAVKITSSTSFTMMGGEICDFSSKEGGAFYVSTGNTSCLTLNGTGKITNCSATDGGAVYTLSPIYIYDNFTMEYNSASQRGGAICIAGYYGKAYISGSPVITNNNCVMYGEGQGGGAIFVTEGGPNPYASSQLARYDNAIRIAGTPTISGNTTSGNIKNNVHFYGNTYYNCFNAGKNDLVGGDICFSVEDYDGHTDPIVEDVSSPCLSCFHIENDEYMISPKSLAKCFYIKKIATSYVPLVSGYSLILDGSQIGIKCHVKIPEDYDISKLTIEAYLDSSTAYKGIIHKTTLYPDSAPDANGIVTFTYGVSAVDMSSKIYFDLMENTTELTSEYNFNIANYARVAYNNTSDEKTKNIIEGMTCYGAAVQTYFKHNIYSLPNFFVPYEHREAIANYNISSENLSTTINYAQAEDSPTKYYGASMVFDSSPKMKFYFINPKDASVMDDLRVTINDKTAEIQAIDDYYFAVVTDSISISDLTKGIMVTVELKSENRFVAELSYSPMNYVARTYANSKDTNSKKMVAALWVYWKAMTSNNSDPAI